MATPGSTGDVGQESRFEKARHVKYWLRCIKTLLPHHYTGNDSNRMYLAFLMVSALDLLDVLTTSTSPVERHDYVDWIYRCQHADGGFRMWPGTDLGQNTNEANAKWDPAHVPATYFALAALLILGDDLERVKRRMTLQWLHRMQRSDGSFAETMVDGRLEGGSDPRFAHCVCGIRYILRGTTAGTITVDNETVDDIDIDAMVCDLSKAESFEGGIADEALHEPHAGYTFCALGASRFVDRLNTGNQQTNEAALCPRQPEEVVGWLVYLQTDLSTPDAMLDSEFLESRPRAKLSSLDFDQILSQQTALGAQSNGVHSSISFDACAGMSGRTNKVADTCYAFWAGASLCLLEQPNLYDRDGVRKYLLEKTQNPLTGGFGKFPGDPPDLYHSYLGLAALSLTGSNEIKSLDSGMCISNDAKARLKDIWQRWEV